MRRIRFRSSILPLLMTGSMLLQFFHMAHKTVICSDRTGMKLECADILGRCHCHMHRAVLTPTDHRWEISAGNGHLVSCSDISIATDNSLAAQVRDSVEVHFVYPPVMARTGCSLPLLGDSPFRYGPAPPCWSFSSTIDLSVWRC